MKISELCDMPREALEKHFINSYKKVKAYKERLIEVNKDLSKLIKTLKDNNINIGWETLEKYKDKWFKND